MIFQKLEKGRKEKRSLVRINGQTYSAEIQPAQTERGKFFKWMKFICHIDANDKLAEKNK